MGVCLGAILVDLAACSSSDSTHRGKRVEFGQWADAGDAGSAVDAADGAGATVGVDGGGELWIPIRHPDDKPRFPSEIVEEDWGLTLSEEEKERVNTCSRRPWSKNVPDRDCTKDSQCGDGLCDRGHCAAIITCLYYPGAPCKTDKHCRGLCMEGRCRSCVSDEECQRKSLAPNAACDAPGSHPPGRSCAFRGSSPPPDVVKEMCDAAPANKKPAYCAQP